MRFGVRGSAVALAISTLFLTANIVRAGDDGAAPLWVGIGSVVGPLIGFNKEEKDPIEYREHGKIVVPPRMDLPPPAAAAAPPAPDASAWPVNQEVQRKKIAKESAKKEIAGQGDARLRYTHPFPNAPVTVRAADEESPNARCADGKCQSSSSSSSLLGNLNPLSWVGMGKSAANLGPEPDREWLTDPPKGYRAPLAPGGQAAN